MSTDLQNNARRLATDTGGFAMDNSNDCARRSAA